MRASNGSQTSCHGHGGRGIGRGEGLPLLLLADEKYGFLTYVGTTRHKSRLARRHKQKSVIPKLLGQHTKKEKKEIKIVP